MKPVGRDSRWIGVARSIGIAAAIALIYYLTRERTYSWDAMAYAARASRNPFATERFLSMRMWHPHHLLYMPLATGFTALVRALSFGRIDAMSRLQLMSVLAGAGAVLVFYGILRRLAAGARSAQPVPVPAAQVMSERAAAAGAAAFGVTNAIWIYSGTAEVMLPTILLVMIGVRLLVGTRPRWIAAGLCLGGAVLLHQIAVFAFLGIVLSLALPFGSGAGTGSRTGSPPATGTGSHARSGAGSRESDATRARARGNAIRLFSAGAMVVVAAYLAVAVFSVHARSAGDIASWMTTVRERSEIAGLGPARALRIGARSIVIAFVALGRLRDLARPPFDGADLFGVLSALALACVALLLALARPRIPAGTPGRVVRGTLWGTVLTAAFILWFEPGNVEYWVYVCPFLAIPVILGASARARERSRVAATALLAMALLAAANVTGTIVPLMDRSAAPYDGLVRLVSQLKPEGEGAVVLTNGGGDTRYIAVPLLAGVPSYNAPQPDSPQDGERFRGEIGSAVARVGSGKGWILTSAEGLAALRAMGEGDSLRSEELPEVSGRRLYLVRRSR